MHFYIHAGSFVDMTALQAMPLNLPRGNLLFADAGNTCYEVEDLLAECDGVELRACRKSKSKRADELHLASLKNYYSKRIETTFSGLTSLFP